MLLCLFPQLRYTAPNEIGKLPRDVDTYWNGGCRGTLSGTTSTFYGTAILPRLFRSLSFFKRQGLYGYITGKMSTKSQKVNSADQETTCGDLHQEYYHGVLIEIMRNNKKIWFRLLGRSAVVRYVWEINSRESRQPDLISCMAEKKNSHKIFILKSHGKRLFVR
jgi:hypothetical protein